MVPHGFDQTNGKIDGLRGDDGGVLAPAVPEPTMTGFVASLLGARAPERGASAVDHDPSITPYSEEGVL
jgi:hypothetical protein